ncbi:protein kinase superfamily protein [Actinidia rufa]|uniref:Protein kinase superfamily protein n=1 Tax=Actinidia rufa TaxID=165716 RepID=A0A7J0EH93_9ERIC|nr:protein kinase superfamily protein [Actinidia rufa]
MGCTQAKHSTNSPPRGLQKLKMENGYVKAKYPDARRSTGQRYAGVPKPEARNSSAGNSGRLVGGGSKDGNLITREAKKDSGGSGDGNILKRMTSLNLGGEEELVDGWPKWLTDNIPKDVLAGIVPRSAESYEKLDKVGQGTYSNVYKARDRTTGKIVALKKVRFDTSEPESVKFMAREIVILQKLDHPNILKLEGLATSRMQYSLYLVFDYMQSDLARIISRPDERLTEPQVEQLHRIFKLCGTPSEEYWKKLKVSPTFKPPHAYKSNFREVFRAFPSSSLGLLNTLLALDPTYRGSASSALRNEFFCTSPLACDLSGLPVIYKEEDEPMQTSERRRHRNPKMRRRSRTLQERQKKDLAEVAMEQPKGDSAKEEAEKIVGLNLQQGSSSTSTSSSIKHTIQEGTPRLSLSSNESCQKNMSPSSKAHPKATNNIKNLPPLPNAKTRIAKYNGDGDDRYTFSQIQRSTSTREFRKLDQRKFHKLHAVDD